MGEGSSGSTGGRVAMKREVGLGGAVLLGLGSIVGTGVYVSIAIAAGAAGSGLLIAIAGAAVLALFNGLSSAQLAAAYPVSGGTYEYGYRTLRPWLGFTAGWMFICAKSASAATAALGLSGYVFTALGIEAGRWAVWAALGAVIAVTVLVAGGVRRSNLANAVLVTVSIGVLGLFVVLCLPSVEWERLRPAIGPGDGGRGWRGVLEGCALMFVAYTGYGRIATLGEEVTHPRRTIPAAIIVTLAMSALLYAAVGGAAVGAIGAESFGKLGEGPAAPLGHVLSEVGAEWAGWVMVIGAAAAMGGVLLNLVLGLSRVLLAMGRRGDAPGAMGRLSESGQPVAAVWVVGAIVAGLTLIGSMKTAWSFSAFTVLIYYAITNAAALRLRAGQRVYPRVFGWLGLAGCIGLAWWVEPVIWMIGLALIAAGLAARWVWRAASGRSAAEGAGRGDIE